jgi:hypothetical protein
MGVLLAAGACPALAQFGAQPQKKLPPPAVNWTAGQDHQNMMEQLGIQAIRPGPSGNEKAPNHANYDEAKANPYPNLPDALTLDNGEKVTTAAQWWNQRRPQLVTELSRSMYGFVPSKAPKVTWTVELTDHERVGFMPVVAKRLIGHVDNSAYPLINVDIQMVVVTPANARGPVPLLMMFGPATLPAPAQPTPDQLETINAALRALLARDPAVKAILDQYPAYEPVPPAPRALPPGFGQPPAPGTPPPDPPTINQLIAAGWGFARINPTSVQADNGAGLTRGVIGLVNKGQPRHPDDWGALRAWAWGASRGLDYLETDPAVDAKHVGIEGVSRYGKAALVTLAFDQRFYMGLIGSSGEGGAKPSRRNFGESLDNLTNTGEYHWMAGNFIQYGATKSKFGAKNPGDLPVDANDLIALCAPRLTFISYGVPELGDAKWLDQQGSFMATVAAQPVWRLLGAKGLGVPDDYHTAKMPPVDHGLLDGQLAWRQAYQPHTDARNVKYFIAWADGFMGRSAPAPR